MTGCWRTYQVLVAESFSDTASDEGGHLIVGIEGAVIVPALELPEVAGQVLMAHVVIDAVVSPLEERPMGLDAVGVDISPDIFVGMVADRKMGAVNADVSRSFIGIYDGRCEGSGCHERMEGGPVGGHNDRGGDLVGLAVLDAGDDALADATSAFSELLVEMLVWFSSADKGFISLDGSSEGVGGDNPGLADSVG